MPLHSLYLGVHYKSKLVPREIYSQTESQRLTVLQESHELKHLRKNESPTSVTKFFALSHRAPFKSKSDSFKSEQNLGGNHVVFADSTANAVDTYNGYHIWIYTRVTETAVRNSQKVE